jgi:DMSO/TMAO reductase YedYZ molybdopterin-dependent catalytic subunit
VEEGDVRKQSADDPANKSRVPPGQTVTEGFPVLHYGRVPRFDPAKWDFSFFGLVEKPFKMSYDEFTALPKVRTKSDIHCVTSWSRLDNEWEGVPAVEVINRARLLAEAKYVIVHAEERFTTNLSLEDITREGVLFASKHDGANLSADHGWPLRLVVPHLYFWKSAKWVRGLEFIATDRPGFWETHGYHMRGDPWKEERYG